MSSAYSVMLFWFSSATSIVEIFWNWLAIAAYKSQDTNYISALASGPYGLIFDSFISFSSTFPSHHDFVFLVLISATNRSYTLLACSFFYLLGSIPLFVVFVVSLLVCSIVSLCLAHRMKLPWIIAAFFTRCISFWKFISALKKSCWKHAFTYRPCCSESAVYGFAPLVEPPEFSIAILVSMGFDSNAARQALVRAGSDINVATNVLLEAASFNSQQLYWEPLRALLVRSELERLFSPHI